MVTKLIVDGGATKTEWVLLRNGKISKRFISQGFNPYYTDKNKLSILFNKIVPKSIDNNTIDYIWFYGTGCSNKENCKSVSTMFENYFSNAKVFVHHDLYGTALALFQDKSGIACILGTGSNSCIWDGKKIVKNIPSLGYLLADEGSGTYLGKLLLKEILTDKTDIKLKQLLFEYTGLDFNGILNKVYHKPDANRWIASLAKFAKVYINHPDINSIVRKNFQDFFIGQIVRYDGFEKLPVGFTGSIAFYFQDTLKKVSAMYNIKITGIMKEPMQGLVNYHKNNQ